MKRSTTIFIQQVPMQTEFSHSPKNFKHYKLHFVSNQNYGTITK